MAPSNQEELVKMIKTSALINDFPSAFRYPRGVVNIFDNKIYKEIEIGKGQILAEGEKVAILSLGTRLETCLDACIVLNDFNIKPTVADARFAKPLDTDLIDHLLETHEFLVTIEEGSIGGFASHVINYINNIKKKRTKTIN